MVEFDGNVDPGFGMVGVLMGFIMMLFGVIAVFGLICYVINGIFQSKLLKAAGHKSPVSAWVPVWNLITLWETAGLRKAWLWLGVLIGASFVGGLIPYVGFVISLAATVAIIGIYVLMGKSINAGLGRESVGTIVLLILLPLIWMIWAGSTAAKQGFNTEAAHEDMRKTMPAWVPAFLREGGDSELAARFE